MSEAIKVIGIDPGKDGGVAMVGPGGELLRYRKVPKIGKEYDESRMVTVIAVLCGQGARAAAIEAYIAMPGLASNALVTIGVGHGLWRGAIAAAGLGYEIIPSRVWQVGIPGRSGANGKNLKGKELKQVLIAHAVKRWPEIPKHSGICDAALIAEFHRRRLVGGAAALESVKGEG